MVHCIKKLISFTLLQNLKQTHLLIIAPSSARRKTRGLSFPGCGLGVTLPISTKPKPILCKPIIASPSLSNPAAIPIGLLKSLLQTLVFCNANKDFYQNNKIKYLLLINFKRVYRKIFVRSVVGGMGQKIFVGRCCGYFGSFV